MKSGKKDRIKGKFHQIDGKIKETVGRVLNNSKLEAKGKAVVVGGKVQETIGEAEKRTSK